MSSPDAPSRRARLGQRRRGQRLAVLVLVTLVVAGVAVAIIAGRDSPEAAPTTALGRGARRHHAESSTTASTVPSTDPRTKIAHILPPRSISHDQPLRVWVGGDSLSGELGPSLGNLLGPTGVVKVTVDFKVGSGLHDNGLRNWPIEVANQMAMYDPDVAVFMIGANDASIVGDDASRWLPQYQAKIDRVMDTLAGDHHRTVLWIGPPPLRDHNLDRGAKALGLLMAHEAAARHDVVYVDGYSMFAGPDGTYDNHLDLSALTANPRFDVKLASSDLTRVLVRISDGVHFTDDGATWLAYQVAVLLDRQWNIVGQAGGDPISVTIEHGGGSIPGYRTHHTTPSWQPPASTSTTSAGGGSTTTAPTQTSTTEAHGSSTTTPPTTAGVTTTT